MKVRRRLGKRRLPGTAAGRGSLFCPAAWLLAIFCLAALIIRGDALLRREAAYRLEPGQNESQGFRAMAILPEAYEKLCAYTRETGADQWQLLAAAMLAEDFVLEEWPGEERAGEWESLAQDYARRGEEAFFDLAASYQAVLGDIQYFPVPTSSLRESADVSYENSWMFERSFGGMRGHEGTDLMPEIAEAGLYPVVSMTSGTVERIGWLEKGGYRVGVRSPYGGYFYYAHLSAYAEDFQEGDAVHAGQLLGYMGDTGYGKEGTTGQFAVHLHLGIYIQTSHYQELSVNPYWVLKAAEPKRLTYKF